MEPIYNVEVYPKTVMESLTTIFPSDDPEIDHYDVKQEVVVFDPRLIICDWTPREKFEKVIVKRVKKLIPQFKDGNEKRIGRITLVPTKTIEILKEYTFEEWDKGMIWEK